MLNRDEVKEIKREIGYEIIGSFIRGISNDITNLSQFSFNEVGKSFCEFGDNKINPLDPDSLCKTDTFFSNPDRTYPLAENLKLAYQKIDSFVSKAEGYGFSDEKVYNGLIDYSKKIKGIVSEIAFGEGDTSEDMKQNLRVLLKIGVDEFDKRAKEDEQLKEQEQTSIMEPDNSDMNMDSQSENPNDGGEAVEDDSDYMNEFEEGNGDDYEEQSEEEFGNEQAEEGSEETSDENSDDNFEDDYENAANGEFGSDDDEPEEDEEENDDDEIPNGESFSFYENKGYGEALNYTKMLKAGYKIPGLTREEEQYLKSIANYGPGRMWKALERGMKVLSHKFNKNDSEQVDASLLMKKDVNYIEGFNKVSIISFFEVLKWYMILDTIILSGIVAYKIPEYLFYVTVERSAGLFLVYHLGKFTVRMAYKDSKLLQQHLNTYVKSNERAIEIYKDILSQAEKKNDRMVINKCKRRIAKLEKYIYEVKNNWMISAKENRDIVDILKDIDNNNILANYSSDMKYIVNGEFTSMSEAGMREIIEDTKILEEQSYQALSESNGYMTGNSEIRHKGTVQLFITLNTVKNNLGLI